MILLACPVCYAPTDAVVRESLNWGIFVLLGVTAIVLACVAHFIVTVARRSREPVVYDDHGAKDLGPELAEFKMTARPARRSLDGQATERASDTEATA